MLQICELSEAISAWLPKEIASPREARELVNALQTACAHIFLAQRAAVDREFRGVISFKLRDPSTPLHFPAAREQRGFARNDNY